MPDFDNARMWISLIVLTGLLLSIGVIVISEIGTGELSTNSTENLTVDGWTTSANFSISENDRAGFELDTGSVRVYNITGGGLYTASTDYIAYSSGTLSWVNSTDDTGDLNLTFTYKYSGTVESSTFENSTLSLSNFSRQLPTVGTVLGVLLIIIVVVILAGYMFSKKTY